MAVYEGARPRSMFLPRRRLERPLLRPQAPLAPRRPSRVAFRTKRHPRVFGIAIGLIVIAFMLSFFSLIQTARDVTRQIQAQREIAHQQARELDRLAELERFQRLTVGRELKMIELKKEIEYLRKAGSTASPPSVDRRSPAVLRSCPLRSFCRLAEGLPQCSAGRTREAASCCSSSS